MKVLLGSCLVLGVGAASGWLFDGAHAHAETGGGDTGSLCQDSNGDGSADISDAIHFLSWLFSGGPAPVCSTPEEPPADLEDGPSITLDPAANITDVHAFVQQINNVKVLVVAMGVSPLEEPGVGPNTYRFDKNVLYELHVALGNDLAAGKPTLSYQFQLTTAFKDRSTILATYLGVVQDIGDAAQSLTQTYTVTKLDHRNGSKTSLGSGTVPPNNQGNVTPFYNQGDNGENPAREGVAAEAPLDKYTRQGSVALSLGYRSFAGQRDDGFYGDMQSLFDLLRLRSPGKDSRGGFNLHQIVLAIPVSELGGDQQSVGVYATTSRRRSGRWVQVARQGNPLFSELFVAIGDRNLYNCSAPSQDDQLFRKYAETPELARLINSLVFGGSGPAVTNGRTDISAIFIPDLVRVDLSTGPCRLAGGGAGHPTNPDEPGFSRLSIFGGDTLTSAIQPGFGNGTIPGGWPNGRRFGDDVVDIVVSLLLSDLRGPLVIRVADGVDGVSRNDQGYNKVFPYASTPHNGRSHSHP